MLTSTLTSTFPGDSELARLMREFDWGTCDFGDPALWPETLRTVVRVCLTSRFPTVIWWGPNFGVLYNDAYIPFLGHHKHPRSLGRPGRECWPEIWDTIGPMLESVYRTGKATWSDDMELFFDRTLPREEVFVTFTYGPILAADGRTVEGVYCPCTETTEKITSGRRLETLRQLGEHSSDTPTIDDACRRAASVLAQNPYDIPFAAIYELDCTRQQADLRATAGFAPGAHSLPLSESTIGTHASLWPFASVSRTRRPHDVDLREADIPLPGGEWPEPASTAIVMPVISSAHDTTVSHAIVLGVSARRPLDQAYRTFFDLVASHISIAIATARAYEDERQRAEALAELDRAKTTFFSNVSHEFRTPLTLMLGPLEDVLAGTRGVLPDEVRIQLDVAHRNSLRLLKLVNTLLDFSRIEAGRIEASYEPTDLASATIELAGVFRSAIEKAGLTLMVDCPPLPEPVHVDRDMWEKVVLNLLSNAFKFTFEGSIDVALRWLGDRVELRVRDTGGGIPAAEQPKVFDRFHRIRGGRARTHEGTGIGLALVQELARLHGGTVSVESTEGLGTTFAVSVKTGTAHLPPDRIGSERTLRSTAVGVAAFVEEAERWVPGSSSGAHRPEKGDPFEPPGRPAGADTGPATARPRIVWAEDNADMRDYVTRLLASSYDVEAVADGAAALEAAHRAAPDLVLADVMMPALDGFALLRALRADPLTADVPVVLLSARAGEESRVEGMQHGADDYLTKPFSARELLARVEGRVSLSRVRHELMAVRKLSDIRLRRLINVEAVCVLLFRDDGTLIDANDEFLHSLGYSRDDVRSGTLTWRSMTPAEYVAVSEEQMAHLPERGRIGPYEKEYLRRDGSRLWMLFAGVSLGDGTVIKYGIDINNRKRAEQALRDSEDRLRRLNEELEERVRARTADLAQEVRERTTAEEQIKALFMRLVSAQEEERYRIAREIHDHAGQQMTALKMSLEGLQRMGAGRRAMLAQLERTEHLAQALDETLDYLTWELRPATLDHLGLVAALKDLVKGWSDRFGVAAEIETEVTDNIRLRPDVETNVYRLMQEALHNIVKHAQATRVSMTLQRDDRELVLVLEDNGRGFDVAEATHRLDGSGLGLVSMRERALLAGGHLEIESAPDGGTSIFLRIPLGDGHAA